MAKFFKLSQLEQMRRKTLSKEDLFLVSDYNGGKCDSKSIEYGELSAQLQADIQTGFAPEVIPQISGQVSTAISGDIKTGIFEDLKTEIDEIVCGSANKIL